MREHRPGSTEKRWASYQLITIKEQEQQQAMEELRGMEDHKAMREAGDTLLPTRATVAKKIKQPAPSPQFPQEWVV